LYWEIKKALTAPVTKHELDREEKRSVFFLGLLAVMVTLRVSAKDSDQFPFLGVQYNLVPLLNVLIYGWVTYAAMMLIFISDDIFSSRNWIIVRRLFQIIGVMVGLEVPFILLWVMVSTPSIFVLPIWLFPYIIVLPFLIPVVYLYIGVGRSIWRKFRDRRATKIGPK
jgi:hypothetical protein